MNLRTLDDAELLRHAQIDFDPITGTELEAELLRRFEENAAVTADNEPLLKVCEEHGFDSAVALDKALKALGDVPAETAGALLETCSEFDIDDPATLKKALERNAKFEDLMNDLAEPLASLQALITTE